MREGELDGLLRFLKADASEIGDDRPVRRARVPRLRQRPDDDTILVLHNHGCGPETFK